MSYKACKQNPPQVMQPPNHQIVGLGAEFDRSSGRITCPGGEVVEMVVKGLGKLGLTQLRPLTWGYNSKFGEVESKVEVRWCLGIYEMYCLKVKSIHS